MHNFSHKLSETLFPKIFNDKIFAFLSDNRDKSPNSRRFVIEDWVSKIGSCQTIGHNQMELVCIAGHRNIEGNENAIEYGVNWLSLNG